MALISPVQGIPAAVIRSRKSILCVGDLHLGYELELRESGFNLPDQLGHVLETLINIDAGEQLFILGDLKHTIPFVSRDELADLSRFFSSLQERFPSITIIAGNHDGALERSLPDEVSFIRSQGLRVGSVGFVHGHGWPSEDVMRAKTLLWAHLHPSIRMFDRLGASLSIKCWLRGPVHPEMLKKRYDGLRVTESVIMPAFNHLLIGTPANENPVSDLSPLTRSGFIALEEQHAYTLDGVDLGVLSALSKPDRRRKAR